MPCGFSIVTALRVHCGGPEQPLKVHEQLGGCTGQLNAAVPAAASPLTAMPDLLLCAQSGLFP